VNSDVPGSVTRPLRRDAQRNREAIVTAARSVFAEHGLEAPLEKVARMAGVAIGTLYRNFPTRLDLIEALFAEKLQDWIKAGEQALAMEDSWEGFAFYLEKMCELQASDRGFNDLASMRFPDARHTVETQARIYDLSRRIVRRAHDSAVLRADVTAEDLAFLIWSQARIIQATRTVAPRAWRRYLGLILDAFRAERAHTLPEPPLRPADVRHAMLTLSGSEDRLPR
jgi:AcrR family transcriptional regulator